MRNWRRLIDETRELGIAELRLSGGEPLLIDNIQERCEAIRDNGLSFTITTNGSLLSKHLPWLERTPPSTLWVSYHREYVSVNRFVTNVRDASSRGVKVGINLFDIDVVAFPHLIGQLMRVGVFRFKLIKTTNIGRAVNLNLKPIHDPNMVRRIVATQQREFGNDVEIRAEFPLIEGTTLGAESCVLRARSLLSIDFDGSVYPCCVTLGLAEARIGDLTVESLKAVVARVAIAPKKLPCEGALPSVASGSATCPLALMSMK